MYLPRILFNKDVFCKDSQRDSFYIRVIDTVLSKLHFQITKVKKNISSNHIPMPVLFKIYHFNRKHMTNIPG